MSVSGKRVLTVADVSVITILSHGCMRDHIDGRCSTTPDRGENPVPSARQWTTPPEPTPASAQRPTQDGRRRTDYARTSSSGPKRPPPQLRNKIDGIVRHPLIEDAAVARTPRSLSRSRAADRCPEREQHRRQRHAATAQHDARGWSQEGTSSPSCQRQLTLLNRCGSVLQSSQDVGGLQVGEIVQDLPSITPGRQLA